MRTSIYSDGFNLYYRAVRGTPFKWLDLKQVCECLPDAESDSGNDHPQAAGLVGAETGGLSPFIGSMRFEGTSSASLLISLTHGNLIIALQRNDMTHTAARIGRVALVARDHMDVGVPD